MLEHLHNGIFDWNYDSVLNLFSAKLVARGELEVNNFFISSCNDVGVPAGKIFGYFKYFYSTRISGATRVLPIIDDIPEIKKK